MAYSKKTCVLCRKDYIPITGSQKACLDCKDEYQRYCVRRYNLTHKDKLYEINRKWYFEKKQDPKWYERMRKRKREARSRKFSNDPTYRKMMRQRNKDTYKLVKETVKSLAKCVFCSAGWPLECDHMDGNPYNHELSNLQWLCVACHDKKHDRQRFS